MFIVTKCEVRELREEFNVPRWRRTHFAPEGVSIARRRFYKHATTA